MTGNEDLIKELGEARKAAGLALAARHRQHRIRAAQLAFLEMLLRSPDGTGTLDDIVAESDLAEKFPKGGKWRGAVVHALAMDGLIEWAGVERSMRPARHRGYVTRWKLTDRDRARHYVARLTAWLERNSPELEPQDRASEVVTELKDIACPQQGYLTFP